MKSITNWSVKKLGLTADYWCTDHNYLEKKDAHNMNINFLKNLFFHRIYIVFTLKSTYVN